MTVEDARLVLGISKNQITEEELKHAFYTAAQLTHPDSNPENAYAKSKFAMIQEAYEVLRGTVIKLGTNQAAKAAGQTKAPGQAEASGQAKAPGQANAPGQAKGQGQANAAGPSKAAEKTRSTDQTKARSDSKGHDFQAGEDPWIKYNQADRRFARMRQEQKQEKLKRAFARREAAQKNATEKIHSANEHASSNRYEKGAGATIAASAAISSGINFQELQKECKDNFLLFLQKDVLFDGILAFCIAVFVVIFAICHGSFNGASEVTASLLSWLIALLFGRRVAKALERAKHNMILSLLSLLIAVELIVGLFRLFLL